MRGLLIRWATTAFALWLTSQVIAGIEVQGVLPLFFAAMVLGVLNALLRPLVLFLTLPINLLTLGRTMESLLGWPVMWGAGITAVIVMLYMFAGGQTSVERVKKFCTR